MSRKGVNVFLTELVVMTAVLAIALTICLNVFLAASDMRTSANRLSRGSSLVYSALQCYHATGSIEDASVLMGGDGGDIPFDDLTLRFHQDDEGWVEISAYHGDQLVFTSDKQSMTLLPEVSR